jgi:putative DNA primase/helicase
VEFINNLRDVMIKNDLPYSGVINFESGHYTAFNSEGICKKKCCRYRIFENFLGAHLRCWRRGIDVYWFFKEFKTFTTEEKRKFNQDRAKFEANRREEEREAINLAKEEWGLSTDFTNHPYVTKKSIIPYEARIFDGDIILPVHTSSGDIVSNQKIYANGFKKFARGAPIKGNFLVIGDDITANILICEGWATGCSLHEATNCTVIVSFNSSNMFDIAKFIKHRLDSLNLIYCADKDANQIGERFAIKAAKITGGIVVLPQFMEKDQSFTDFNDVHRLYGKAAVNWQLNTYLK